MAETAEIYQFPGPSEAPKPEESEQVKASVDNGFVMVPTEVLEQMAKSSAFCRRTRVALALICKTFGYHKELDWVSNSQVEGLTGIDNKKVTDVKSDLMSRKIITKDGRKTGINLVLADWAEEKSLNTGKENTPQIRGGKSPDMGSTPPDMGKNTPKDGAHKRNKLSTKETITKDHSEANAIAARVIDHLNTSAGKKFKHTQTNIKFIRARLKEGHTETDLITVIDSKVTQWLKDPRMNEYLRPATLFNSEKFEGYLNASAPVQGFAQTDYHQGTEGFEHV